MKIIIDRKLKVLLLQSLQRGYLETDELPDEFIKDNSFFHFLMKTSSVKQDVEGPNQVDDINFENENI